MVASLPVGRKKKEDHVKRTYRMSRLVLKMVEMYAADTFRDSTSAINVVLFEYLSTLGYRKRAEDALKAEDAENQAGEVQAEPPQENEVP
jgi:hypothetical protein